MNIEEIAIITCCLIIGLYTPTGRIIYVR